MNVHEFIKVIISYCLLNYEGLIMFVFRIIDSDNDEIVTLKDIYNFCCTMKDENYVFPINIIRRIEYITLDEDEFDIDVFKRIIEKLDFLIFPALFI